MAVGIGYDSHRFAADRPLILGGVRIEHEMGLDGHSDADVVTHAIIDALLGAAGEGDIGELFPDTDVAWKDADSIEMLKVAVGRIGGDIVNIDVTVIGEAPLLGPYKAAMRQVLADATSARVNIKATTNEQMGWIGRGEGLACIAAVELSGG